MVEDRRRSDQPPMATYRIVYDDAPDERVRADSFHDADEWIDFLRHGVDGADPEIILRVRADDVQRVELIE